MSTLCSVQGVNWKRPRWLAGEEGFERVNPDVAARQALPTCPYTRTPSTSFGGRVSQEIAHFLLGCAGKTSVCGATTKRGTPGNPPTPHSDPLPASATRPPRGVGGDGMSRHIARGDRNEQSEAHPQGEAGNRYGESRRSPETRSCQAACEIKTGRGSRTVAPAPGFDDSGHHEGYWLGTTCRPGVLRGRRAQKARPHFGVREAR